MSPQLISQCHISFPKRDPALAADRTHGFTLIEVLVTLLVLSIGLLGLASLQTQGLRGTHEALLRTQATTLAVDMMERLQADKLGVHDLRDWKIQLAQRLPEGDGNVTKDAALVTVQVSWNERGAPQRFALSFTP